MNKSGELKSSNKTARVKVEKLSQSEKELKKIEVENIRGGGGSPGGVLGDRGDTIIPRPGR